MGKHNKKTLKDFSWRYGVKLVAVIAGLGAGAAYASARYTIGIDTQETRCLDEWFYVIDTWRKPTAAEIERNQYVAVVLTAAQTPKNALWGPGQVMVKRAVATDPGDEIRIAQDGITFKHGADSWSHGTGLESARLLGTTPDTFEREITLGEGEIFLMGDNFNSYDGRYYGPTSEGQVSGTVLWAF